MHAIEQLISIDYCSKCKFLSSRLHNHWIYEQFTQCQIRPSLQNGVTSCVFQEYAPIVFKEYEPKMQEG